MFSIIITLLMIKLGYTKYKMVSTIILFYLVMEVKTEVEILLYLERRMG